MPTNPNGANQYQLDPRQNLCWENYVNPKSETFGNAKQSAISAGYEEDYADQITTSEWFKDKLRRLNMLGKAEKVLDKTLTYEPVDDKGILKVDLLRVQTDVAKHITSTLGKNEGYSSRVEQTGKDGGAIELGSSTKTKELADKLNEIHREGSVGSDGAAPNAIHS